MVNPACLICGVVKLASLHPQKRLCLLHVIANQCLASAEALPSFACHCKTRPCNRTHAPAFCMSLQNTPLQPHPRPRLLHVIANHALATAPTPPPSACHCEPVPCTRRSAAAFCMSLRTSAHTGVAIRVPWQKRGTLLPPPGAHTPTKSVIANQCRGPRKGAPFAGRGATRERCPALAFGRSWAWRTLGRRGAAIRVPWQKRGTLLPPPGAHTPTKSVIANQCAHWCGNPFSPQGNLASWQSLGQIRSFSVFAGNSCVSLCAAARSTDCHVASLLAMTC